MKIPPSGRALYRRYETPSIDHFAHKFALKLQGNRRFENGMSGLALVVSENCGWGDVLVWLV